MWIATSKIYCIFACDLVFLCNVLDSFYQASLKPFKKMPMYPGMTTYPEDDQSTHPSQANTKPSNPPRRPIRSRHKTHHVTHNNQSPHSPLSRSHTLTPPHVSVAFCLSTCKENKCLCFEALVSIKKKARNCRFYSACYNVHWHFIESPKEL